MNGITWISTESERWESTLVTFLRRCQLTVRDSESLSSPKDRFSQSGMFARGALKHAGTEDDGVAVPQFREAFFGKAFAPVGFIKFRMGILRERGGNDEPCV